MDTLLPDDEMWPAIDDTPVYDDEDMASDTIPDEEPELAPPSGYVIGTGAGSLPDGGIPTGGLPADGP
jgi:hypothetical protein